MIERMDAFFAKRVEGYDEHMLSEVEGCREAYLLMAELLPEGIGTLLDLGCGTGLELGPIFDRFSDLRVTGIDLSPAMLGKLRQKFPGKDIELIEGSYTGRDFGSAEYDAAVSFQTLHHLKPEEKLLLYRNLRRALRPGGAYVESDFMVLSQEEERQGFAECARLRREQGVPDGEFVHIDTPCAVDTQLRLLAEAGFVRVRHVGRVGNTSALLAEA